MRFRRFDTPGEEYKITDVIYADDKNLIGKIIKVIGQSTHLIHIKDRGYFLAMISEVGGAFYSGVKLRKVIRTPKCNCSAYPFPHRLGSGRCQEDKGEL